MFRRHFFALAVLLSLTACPVDDSAGLDGTATATNPAAQGLPDPVRPLGPPEISAVPSSLLALDGAPCVLLAPEAGAELAVVFDLVPDDGVPLLHSQSVRGDS